MTTNIIFCLKILLIWPWMTESLLLQLQRWCNGTFIYFLSRARLNQSSERPLKLSVWCFWMQVTIQCLNSCLTEKCLEVLNVLFIIIYAVGTVCCHRLRCNKKTCHVELLASVKKTRALTMWVDDGLCCFYSNSNHFVSAMNKMYSSYYSCEVTIVEGEWLLRFSAPTDCKTSSTIRFSFF